MTATYEDHEAIRALGARYAIAADAHDFDAYVACYTPDGVFEIPGLARLQGPEQLAGMIAGLDFPTLHVTTDPLIDVDGDRATQWTAFVLFARHPNENEMRVLTTARYVDELVRTADGWRFASRTATTTNDLGVGIARLSPAFAAQMAAGKTTEEQA
jgi:ketosteroid isomerase-like protein